MAHLVTVALQLGAGNAALTLQAQVKDVAGTNVGGAVSSGFVNLGQGCYEWTGNIVDGQQGCVVFAAAGIVKAVAALNPAESENADVRTSAVGTEVTEMHGLLGQNSGLRNAVYTGGFLTSYTLFLYDSLAHAQTNDGSTGVLHRYDVQNSFDGSGNLLSSTMARVS